MATSTANRAKSANETKNAANAASAETKNASCIIVAGVPAPKQGAKPTAAEEKAAALHAEIQAKTAALKAALADLERKKELNDHRTKFLATLEHLEKSEAAIKADDLGGEACKIAFQGKPDGYRWENIFTIGKADLMLEFITLLRTKIRAKVEEIETALVQ